MTTSTHLLSVSTPGSDDAREATGIIERQTSHMARLVDDLLDINRISLGKLIMRRDRFDLAESISNLVRGWRASGRLGDRELSLTLEPCRLRGDRVRIEQMVDNLIDNAVKFTSAKGKIAIALACPPGEAVVRVSDDGIGLGPEECRTVFELFAQGQRSQGGLGIGLALVKQLAALHAGTVTATSEGPGHGAAFELRIPRSGEPEQANPT